MKVSQSIDLFPNALDAARGTPSLPAPTPKEAWYQIGVVGQFKGHPRGGYEITPELLRSMAEYFDRRYRANGVELVVDYVHQSLLPGQDAPAAGWIDLPIAAGARTSVALESRRRTPPVPRAKGMRRDGREQALLR